MGSIAELKEFPPAIWCVCVEGDWEGWTRGSMRSITSWEHSKRIMAAWANWRLESSNGEGEGVLSTS